MRILLVQPDQNRTLGLQKTACLEPLGLEMIAGAVRPQHEVMLLDLRFEPGRLPAVLQDFRPRIVGISSNFTVDVYRTFAVAQIVKGINPEIFVLVGGHHPSLRPQDFHHPDVDAIAIGEGEQIIGDLVECLAAQGDITRVAGLVLNQPDGQSFTACRHLAGDLNALPYPDRFVSSPYRRNYYLLLDRPIASVETSRGCPYRCRFCSVWKFYQGKVRFKRPRRVVEELTRVEEPYVFFTDDNFLANVAYSKEIIRLIRERRMQKKYVVQARSDAIIRNRDLVARWREAGLISVFIGFEKWNQAELEALGKENSVENNEKALEILRRVGIEPVASFIVDTDYDHREFSALRRYVKKHRLKVPVFTVLTPFPGTVLFENLKKRLTTTNYELFDVLHAVLPTRLPLTEFYRELAKLWRTGYPPWKLRLTRLYINLYNLWTRTSELAHWRHVLAEGRRLADARYYMKD